MRFATGLNATLATWPVWPVSGRCVSTIYDTRAPGCYSMGVQPATVQRIVRHSAITVTTGTYVEVIEA